MRRGEREILRHGRRNIVGLPSRTEATPAIVSGGIAERARFGPQLAASASLVAFVYPIFEGIAWNQAFGVQAWLKATFGEEFHDFAGSVVVHAVGPSAATTKVFTTSVGSSRRYTNQVLASARGADLQQGNGELRKTG